MANLTDADKVLRNDVGKSIASKLDDIADAIIAQGGGAHSLGQLSDVDIDTTTLAEGQSIVYNSTTQKFENGEVSTVAALDDLTDVSITSAQKGDSLRNDGNGNWVNEPTTIKMTSAEWEAIADKQAWRNAHKDTYLVITDAPNLNETAKQISYDGGTDTVWDKVEAVNGKVTVIDVIPNITMLNNYTLANSRLIKVGQMLVGILEISRSTAFVNNEAMATLPYYDSNFNIIIPSFCSTTDRWNAFTPCNAFINNSNGNLIFSSTTTNVKFVRVPFAIALP